MKITSATFQNNRSYQEDRFCIFEDEVDSVVGVFDGYGTNNTADYAATYTPYIFKALLRYSKFTEPSDDQQIMFRAISHLNKHTYWHSSGSTASIVWVDQIRNVAHVAILGDSPVIIKDSLGNIWQSPEHNVRSNIKEATEAIMRGGRIMNGYLFAATSIMSDAGLQISRALGDKFLHSVLNRLPEVFSVKLNKDSWILVGSDGLFDPGHTNTKQASDDLVTSINSSKNVTAQNLVTLRSREARDDNSTAILLRME